MGVSEGGQKGPRRTDDDDLLFAHSLAEDAMDGCASFVAVPVRVLANLTADAQALREVDGESGRLTGYLENTRILLKNANKKNAQLHDELWEANYQLGKLRALMKLETREGGR